MPVSATCTRRAGRQSNPIFILMIISKIFPILCAALLLVAPGLRADEVANTVKKPVRLAAVFTFSDAVIDSKKSWNLADVKKQMEIAKMLGVKRIYWRVDVGGYYAYPSKVGNVYQSNGKEKSSIDLDASIKSLGDPLRAFAEEARNQGLEFYAWYPIRDRNSTSDSYNPNNPQEAELAAKMGRYPFLSPFLKANPQYNMERRQGDGANINTPVVAAIKLKTSLPHLALTKEDVRIWESDDNLKYEPVEDTWSVSEKGEENGVSAFTIEGLSVRKPWIKIAQRVSGKWIFSGGTTDEWITVKAGEREWAPYVWMVSKDTDPSVGEARFPYLTAHRARYVRNSTPWDTLTKLSFDPTGTNVALYTPAMPPHRYLLGFPCFAYPEVREHELKIIDELLEYPIDGVAICARTHVRANNGEEYGFNPPVVEEYQKRYGVNILKEDFDEQKLQGIHGDFFTLLLKEISERVHAKSRKLVVMFEPERDLGLEFQPGQMSPWWYLGRMDWQWRKWVQEDIVDELLVFTTGFNLPWDRRLQDYLRQVKAEANGKEVSLHYDPDYDPRRQNKEAFINFVKGALSSPDLDELNIFEFVEIHDPSQQLYDAMRSLHLNEEVSEKSN